MRHNNDVEDDMRIEWDESVRRSGVLEFRSTTEDSHGCVRTATVDDLRRACEAAGLTLASAQHAEDLAKLGRKLDAPLSEFRRVLRVGDYESTLDAARRMSREIEVCLGQLDHVMAREKSANLEAYALGRKSAEDQEAAWEAERAELVAQRDGALGNIRDLRNRHVEAYAVLGAKIGERLDVAARRVVAERDALAAELSAIRAATGEEPTDEALVESSGVDYVRAYDPADLRKAYNLGRSAALGEVARMREEVATLRARVEGLGIDLNSAVMNAKACEVEANNLRSSCRALRARVAELEAAPQGQPVATDEEVVAVFVAAERDALVTHRMGCAAADRYGALAVARHVRAERPACLVARAGRKVGA